MKKGGVLLKDRISPHGNRDSMKDEVRKDSRNAQLDVIMLALWMETGMDAVLDHVEIKEAYLQSVSRGLYT